ncbi:MAG: DUF4845 domain-containing protein [bacterium]|nr:DUF4845 domain-containing protein [bacterium]
MMQKQKGMTVIGMLVTVLAVLMAAIVVMRVIPVYIQHYSVVKAIKALNETPVANLTGDPASNVGVLRRDIEKRLDINGLEYFKENQLAIVPTEQENKYRVVLKYQVIKPLI